MPNDPAFFREMAEAVGVGVAAYRDDGRFDYVNPAYADLLAADREALEGTAVWEVNPAFSRERFDDYWDSFDLGETRVAETTHAFDGTTVEVAVTTTCATIGGDRYHFGTIQDRSQERKREREIEFQRLLLKAQQEATIDGILIVDEDDEILSYNERFAEMWDVPERLIEVRDDEPVLDRVVKQVENPEEFLERVEYLYDHPEEDSRDLIEVKDGRVIDRYTTAVTDEDTYYGRLWVFRDITDRVERQKRLERQNEHLDQFASVVSHDLRNPLNVARGRIDLIAEDCDTDHVAPVERALERMETIIDDVLALAREGQSVEDLEPVALSTVARDAWATVESEDGTLRVDVDFAVEADESRLAQAFENLYRNAVEYGGPGVTVTVGSLPGGFYVGDDGPGIPPEARDEAFDIGFTTATSGTGFGLAIVREIIEAHGWQIEAGAGSDGGARFEVTGVERVEA